MTIAIWAAAVFCGLATIIQIATVTIAIIRCRARSMPLAPPADAPPVTIIRPVCGIDNFVETTLRSTFELDYPNYEAIFCVASASDPVVPLVESLIAQHPRVRATLLVGNERISVNPKLNNVFKGWRAAKHDWIAMADSNVLMPRDYIQRLLATWRPDTGAVSSPPVGSHPSGFAAEMECAFLNIHQLRWQYVADTVGFGFAQGKTLFYKRAIIEAAGGIRELAIDTAEDAASTKLVRAAGLRVRLVDGPFRQPLGSRRLADVWNRQVRWAQLRRTSFLGFYIPELASGGVLPLAAAAFIATAADVSVVGSVTALGAVWYGSEMLLAGLAGWHLSPLYPLHGLLRDTLLPALWFNGWRDREFVWRGTAMSVAETEDRAEPA
jgi:ceramide glucosyltransferase